MVDSSVKDPTVLTEVVQRSLEIESVEPRVDIDIDRMHNVVRSDEKVCDGTVRFALPASSGSMTTSDAGNSTIGIPEDELRSILTQIGRPVHYQHNFHRPPQQNFA